MHTIFQSFFCLNSSFHLLPPQPVQLLSSVLLNTKVQISHAVCQTMIEFGLLAVHLSQIFFVFFFAFQNLNQFCRTMWHILAAFGFV